MLDEINEFARVTGWLHGPVLGFASYGVVLFGVLLVLGWWLSRDRGARTMAAALWAGAGTLLAVAVNQPLVNAVHEARPYTANPHLLVLAIPSADYSFPSDHAVMAGAVAAGLWLVDRRLGVAATVAALAMAFARVYIAAHYPHDVLAGLGVGAAVALLGWLILARPLTSAVTRLIGTPLRPLFAAGQVPASPGGPAAAASAAAPTRSATQPRPDRQRRRRGSSSSVRPRI